MSSRWRIFFTTAAAVLALDQLTKLWIVKNLTLTSEIPVIPGFFSIVSVRNRGAAFGFLNRSDIDWQFWLFLAATLVAAWAIIMLVRKSGRAPLLWTGLALVMGGAIGNLVDRIRMREVVDFLDFYFRDAHWPAFNIADVGICVGAGPACGIRVGTGPAGGIHVGCLSGSIFVRTGFSYCFAFFECDCFNLQDLVIDHPAIPFILKGTDAVLKADEVTFMHKGVGSKTLFCFLCRDEALQIDKLRITGTVFAGPGIFYGEGKQDFPASIRVAEYGDVSGETAFDKAKVCKIFHGFSSFLVLIVLMCFVNGCLQPAASTPVGGRCLWLQTVFLFQSHTRHSFRSTNPTQNL